MSRDLDTCCRLFAEVEARRTETLANLSEWSPRCVDFRPAFGSWSATEVLDHIVRVETGTIAEVRTGVRNPHLLGTEDRPVIATFARDLRSDQRFVVPQGAEAVYPDAQTTLPQVAERWEQARGQLGRLLQELAPNDACCGIFCHPFAGWMTFAEVLDYFAAHLYHHGFQLGRLQMSSAHLYSAP